MGTVEVFYANFNIHITDLEVGPIPEPFASKIRQSTTALQRKLAEYEFKNQILRDHTLLKVFRENMRVEIFQRTIEQQSPENVKRKRRNRKRWETEPKPKRSRRDRRKAQMQHVEPDSNCESDYEQDEDDEKGEKNAKDEYDENEEHIYNDYNEENRTLDESDASISYSGKRNDRKRRKTVNKAEHDNYSSQNETALMREDVLKPATENQQSSDEVLEEEENNVGDEESTKEDSTNVKTAIGNEPPQETNEFQEENMGTGNSNDDNTDRSDSDEAKKIRVPRSTFREENWVKHYMDLIEYKEKVGNCDVPNSYRIRALAGWVQMQRYNGKKYREGRDNCGMTKERYEMLDKLGFNWTWHPSWEEFYDMLKEYKAKYGNCHVPREWKENNKLSLWAQQMRQHGRLFRKGKKTVYMTAERHALLDEIGFCWDKQMEDFMEGFERLKKYKEKYGNCNVPTRFEDARLAHFVQHLRRQYKAYEAGKRVDSMTPERIAMLENIGFVWKVGTNFVHLKKSGDK